MGIQQDLIAALGEFVGTTLFLLLALGGAKTAQYTVQYPWPLLLVRLGPELT